MNELREARRRLRELFPGCNLCVGCQAFRHTVFVEPWDSEGYIVTITPEVGPSECFFGQTLESAVQAAIAGCTLREAVPA